MISYTIDYMFVVEMYCNEFEKHTMVQIYLNSSRKSFTRHVFSDSNFLGYNVSTNLSLQIRKFRIHTLTVIILYRIYAR